MRKYINCVRIIVLALAFGTFVNSCKNDIPETASPSLVIRNFTISDDKITLNGSVLSLVPDVSEVGFVMKIDSVSNTENPTDKYFRLEKSATGNFTKTVVLSDDTLSFARMYVIKRGKYFYSANFLIVNNKIDFVKVLTKNSDRDWILSEYKINGTKEDPNSCLYESTWRFTKTSSEYVIDLCENQYSNKWSFDKDSKTINLDNFTFETLKIEKTERNRIFLSAIAPNNSGEFLVHFILEAK